MEPHIDEMFKSYKLNQRGATKVMDTRFMFSTLVTHLDEMKLDSREYSLAKTKLQEACMFTIAAISRQPGNQE